MGKPNKNNKNNKSGGFQSLGLSDEIFRGVMRMGYKVPTPVQRKALPVCLLGGDVVCMARTGSGKTAAFVVPMLERLLSGNATTYQGVRGLILSPTRDLALQTLRVIKSMAKFTEMRAVPIVGGDGMEKQVRKRAECATECTKNGENAQRTGEMHKGRVECTKNDRKSGRTMSTTAECYQQRHQQQA